MQCNEETSKKFCYNGIKISPLDSELYFAGESWRLIFFFTLESLLSLRKKGLRTPFLRLDFVDCQYTALLRLAAESSALPTEPAWSFSAV